MQQSKKKIIIFGSAFNPPHLGHAALLRAAFSDFPCDEVWVMPTGDRLDKKFSASAKDRFQMAKIWLAELFSDIATPIMLSRMELDRGKPTFTHDTHQELSRLYPDNDFYFLVGGDVLSDMRAKWHKGNEVHKNLNFLIVRRPGYDLPEDLPVHSVILRTSGSDISSTNIRSATKTGQDVRDLMPAGVWRFIQEKGLYQS